MPKHVPIVSVSSITASAVALAALVLANPAMGDNWHGGDEFCQNVDVKSMEEFPGFPVRVEEGLDGWGRVCVNTNGIRGRMRVKGLTPKNAYTVWWVYIDRPEDLTGCPGNDPDQIFAACIGTFFGSDPLAVFGRMDSGISNNGGRLHFSNHLDHMRVRKGSQVWLLLFGHGPADKKDLRQLGRQLLTPEDPMAGAPHLGVMANGYPAAVAVFEINEKLRPWR